MLQSGRRRTPGFRMRLRNTSGFSDELVREVYRFVKPNGTHPREVVVRKGAYADRYSGHSWQGSHIVVTVCAEEPLRENDWRRILREQRLKARERPDHSGYLDVACLTPEEVLVLVMAHELRHQWQGLGVKTKWGGIDVQLYDKTKIVYDRPGETITTASGATHFNARRIKVRAIRIRKRCAMVWGARGRFSERDADAYAVRMVRAWRREHRPEPVLDPILFDAPFEKYRIVEATTIGSQGEYPVWFVENRLTRRIEHNFRSENEARTFVGVAS